MLGRLSSNTHIEILTIKEEKKLKNGMLVRELYTQMNRINIVSCGEFEWNIKITTFLEFKTLTLCALCQLFEIPIISCFSFGFLLFFLKLLYQISITNYMLFLQQIRNTEHGIHKLVTQMLQDGTQYIISSCLVTRKQSSIRLGYVVWCA